MVASWHIGLCVALLVAGSALAQGTESDAASNAVAEACRVLARAQAFSFDGSGVSGTVDESAVAFRTIAQGPNPRENFIVVMVAGTKAAKLYALLGLRFTDRRAYIKWRNQLLTANSTVYTGSGCVLLTTEVSQITKEIDEGKYDTQWPVKKPDR